MNRGLGLILTLALLIVSRSSWAGKLNYGRYTGTLQMDGHSEVLAVSMDAFVTQIKDPTVYPELNVIIRVNLGGYFSSEYVAYSFYDPTFNFEKGILSLNDPDEALTATLQLTNTDSQTILEGPVTDRMSGAKGTMRLVMDLDDSLAQNSAAQAPTPFLSVLKGSYRGSCGNQDAELQIETGRGLGPDSPGNTLTGFSITGRLGFSQSAILKYYSLYPYSSGIYSPYTNELTLQGSRGTLNCTKSNDALQCVSQGYDQTQNCSLTKETQPGTPAVQFPAGILLNAPSSAKQPLPAPLPPGNDELVSALNGNFYGFLHYENQDRYQLIEMDSVASTSTENPHIPNQVMVEPSFLFRFGSSWDAAPARSLFFPQRVFYLNPGFAFEADDQDVIAVIGTWRTGYVSGVLYSRSYGRVGTFELIKGARPEIPPQMNLLLDPTGSYQGPTDPNSPIHNLWTLSLEFPNQSSSSHSEDVPLIGRYGTVGHRGFFDSASLDLNTGSLQFLIKENSGDRIVSGQVDSANELELRWPTGPAFGAPMEPYESSLFTRVPENP